MATAPAASTKPTDRLEQLASEMRRSASTLETLASALHRKVAGLKWEGPAAEHFTTSVKGHEAMLAQVIKLYSELASRMQRLVEDARAAEKKLGAAETKLLSTMRQQIAEVEQLAQSTGVPVAQALQPFEADLVKEGQEYQSMTGETTTLGAL